MKKVFVTASHSNYEILRRLPADINALTVMCTALKSDFFTKGLIESADTKNQRTKNRTTSKQILQSCRFITPETHQILSETAAGLDITVPQLVTLLVFLHNPNISWTPKKRSPNKQPQKPTPETKGERE